MAAKPQTARNTPSEHGRAVELLHSLEWTAENRRTIVRAFLEDEGDVPLSVEHSFHMFAKSGDEVQAIDRMIDELRDEHFAKLGQPVPDRIGPPLR